MSTLGNIVWLVFGGFIAAAGYILGGLLLCLTIIGIPFGLQSIELGIASLTPFGKTIQPKKRSGGLLRLVFDAIWFLAVGWEIAIAHIIAGAILCITIVGIPFGVQHFKLVPVALFPFNYEIVR